MLSRHWAAAVLAFVAITVWWLFPLLSNISVAIPGSGAGDNVTFVWNVWWMRYVLHHSGQTFFFTPFLFHPIGVDLTLHTHTALPALIAALSRSPIAGQNVVIAIHIFLNFLCAYALAHRLTQHAVSSCAASIVFGMSTFVSAHLNGHFNLIAVWTLPLVGVVALRAFDRPTWGRGVAGGLALAAVAYTDYYLFVYALILIVLLWVLASARIGSKKAGEANIGALVVHRGWRRTVLTGVLLLLVADATVIAAILLLPGDRLDIGSIHVSLRSVRNPTTVAWILLLVATAIVVYPRIRFTTDFPSLRRTRSAVVGIAVTSVVVLMPLVIHGIALWRSGGYVSQTYLWRSGPSGIDAATVLLGSPYHAVWGHSVRELYERFHIDTIESSGWLPISAVVLAVSALVVRRADHETTPWLISGSVFATWALGPWLTMFGRQTPFVLPGILIRFVPVIANARVPSRAIVGVYLAMAMLAAFGVKALIARGRAGSILASCLVLMLMIESVPSRPPLYIADTPSRYFALSAATRPGAVCELPFGLRDGFGETGSLDEAVLLHQIAHERPIVGGFVARLQPAVARSYESIPILRSLLRLSSGKTMSNDDRSLSPSQAAAKLASAGIAFVVVDTRRASADLIEYVNSRIELRRLGEEDGRVFYEVRSEK